ncbi:hypothetical protein CH339_04925 [Rhodobium orientis]|uniref:Uncharacterized protein n=1 Tax=Rhodobium orientis TaxID=34017 RepID=A0A327JU41_9HYPH|nr:hypothetical protein [Rhodobium orientis]RAI29026.1 hypothetical protein CH339_04925 [Rhodobium orientis]
MSVLLAAERFESFSVSLGDGIVLGPLIAEANGQENADHDDERGADCDQRQAVGPGALCRQVHGGAALRTGAGAVADLTVAFRASDQSHSIPLLIKVGSVGRAQPHVNAAELAR